jgi:hypothetical protein
VAREVHISFPQLNAFTPIFTACLFSYVEGDSLRRRMQMADFAKLAAYLYPDAPEEECLMMSYYHLWVLLYAFVLYYLLLHILVLSRCSFGMTVQTIIYS